MLGNSVKGFYILSFRRRDKTHMRSHVKIVPNLPSELKSRCFSWDPVSRQPFAAARPDEPEDAAMTNLDGATANVQQSKTSPAPQSTQLAVPPPNITHQSSHGSFQAQLQALGDRVKKIPVLPHKQGDDVKGVDYVYGVEKGFDGRIQLFKYVIGPLELDISYDHHTKGVIVDIYLVAPFVSKIKIGTVSGSLVEGLTAKLGYGTSLVGQLGIQKVANEAIMSFNFTAFDKEYKGTVKLFSV